MPVSSNRRQDDDRGRLIAVQTQAIGFEALRQRKFYDVGLSHGFHPLAACFRAVGRNQCRTGSRMTVRDITWPAARRGAVFSEAGSALLGSRNYDEERRRSVSVGGIRARRGRGVDSFQQLRVLPAFVFGRLIWA